MRHATTRCLLAALILAASSPALAQDADATSPEPAEEATPTTDAKKPGGEKKDAAKKDAPKEDDPKKDGAKKDGEQKDAPEVPVPEQDGATPAPTAPGADPDAPTSPDRPTAPDGDTTPTSPAAPGAPAQPGEPSTGDAPEGDPAAPETPEQPATPDSPAAPERPATPEVPETPAEPATPEQPAEDPAAPEPELTDMGEGDIDEEDLEDEDDLLADGDDEDDYDDEPLRIPELDVIGQSPREQLEIPGAARVVTREEIERAAPVDTAEMMRRVAGVHVVGEDGMSLRPNISIRGLDPERSRGALVLEDGVPIATAPYMNPGLYYSTPVERVDRIEVIKGAGAILYGPQTVGGVVNFVTHAPPEEFTARVRAQAGSFGYVSANASVGDTVGAVGYLFEVGHRNVEGPRLLELSATDISARFRAQASATSWFDVKLNVYDEFSRSTYLGLTTPQFANDPRQNHAIFDRFPVRRYGAHLRHHAILGDSVLLQTTAYAQQVSREWQRQDFDRCASPDACDPGTAYERVINGQNEQVDFADAPKDGSGVFFRDSTGNRNRYFDVAGVESRATWNYGLGEGAEGELLAGARVHTEVFKNQRIDGQNGGSLTGVIRDDERYYGNALAMYALNRFMMLDGALRVSPGARVEVLSGQRKIYRQRDENGTPTDLRGPIDETTVTAAFIPGLGVSYDVLDELTVYAGAHRGFSPPRTQDAITPEGDVLELEPEYSINYELGARGGMEDWLTGEVTGFLLDFSNQIIEPTEASGAVTTGLVNAGQTTHVGAEVSVTYDALRQLDVGGMSMPLTVNYTLTRATFGEGWTDDIAGNALPYAPNHLLNVVLDYVHPIGASAQVSGTYVGAQFADKFETAEATLDGTNGELPAYFTLDARLAYTHAPWDLTVFASGKNLTGDVYIASRRPRGIQPGGFRTLMGGVDWSF
jgi:Fe(3+) dicitrate transport protein